MAAVRPSWVGYGKGWWHKMHIRPEYNFDLMAKLLDSTVFEHGPIYTFLGTKMAAIRPFLIRSGKNRYHADTHRHMYHFER